MRLLNYLLLLSMSFCVAAKCQIDVPVMGELPPYYVFKNGQWEGQGISIFKDIATKLGCKLKIIEVPWGRALEMLKDGELSVMTNLTYTVDRSRYLKFIGPHAHENLVLFIKKDQPRINSLSELHKLDKPIAILANGYYGPVIDGLNLDPQLEKKIIKLPSSKQLKYMSNSERTAGFIEDEQVIRFWASEDLIDLRSFHPMTTVYQGPIYIALSRKKFTEQQIMKINQWWLELQS
jgi:polar amino acid transport system substrate-binding protein